MQNVIVDKPYKFVPPYRSTFWSYVFRTFRVHSYYLTRKEGVTTYEMRNIERLQASRRAGHSILICPNHSRTADPLAVGWITVDAQCHLYSMASWHIFQHWLEGWAVQAMGAFSVFREGVDRQAINMAIEVIENGDRPLVIFPEGTTTRTNDRLGPLLDGVAFIARAGAKKLAKKKPDSKVVVHPVAIKYLYQGDVVKAVDEVLTKIETRLSWKPQRQLTVMDRITKVGQGLLALKEIEYFGKPQPGRFFDRMNHLIDRLLHPHEQEWMGAPQSGPVVPRVKALRQKILPDMVERRIDDQERARRWKVVEDSYLAQQISAYPPDYLASYPSRDRVLEFCEKFEEDLYDKVGVHSPTKVILDIGEPIDVSTERDRKAATDPLMDAIEERLQTMLDKLAFESPLYPGMTVRSADAA